MPTVLTSYAGACAERPKNSEIRKIAADAFNAARYVFASVIAEPEVAVRPDSAEAELRRWLATIKPERARRYWDVASQLVASSPPQRALHFGRYAGIEPTEMARAGLAHAPELPRLPLALDRGLLGAPVARVVLPATATARVVNHKLVVPLERWTLEEGLLPPVLLTPGVEDHLRALWGFEAGPPQTGGTSDFEDAAKLDRLCFEISEVRCVDETNPETTLFGNPHDAIALAGVSVDETGDTKKIRESYVGGGFDDGDRRIWSPPWSFHDFALDEGKSWPRVYHVSLMLAEKDHGGLSSFLHKAWEAIGDRVKAVIADVVGVAVAAWFGPLVGYIVGQAVAWVIDSLIGWTINMFKDDIFPVCTASLTHSGWNARFKVGGKWGSPSTAWDSACFSGHGGMYRVRYRWRLHS